MSVWLRVEPPRRMLPGMTEGVGPGGTEAI